MRLYLEYQGHLDQWDNLVRLERGGLPVEGVQKEDVDHLDHLEVQDLLDDRDSLAGLETQECLEKLEDQDVNTPRMISEKFVPLFSETGCLS